MIVNGGTREISRGQWPTSTETRGIRREPKSKGTPREKSEEVIVLKSIETTELDRREGPLLEPR